MTTRELIAAIQSTVFGKVIWFIAIYLIIFNLIILVFVLIEAILISINRNFTYSKYMTWVDYIMDKTNKPLMHINRLFAIISLGYLIWLYCNKIIY